MVSASLVDLGKVSRLLRVGWLAGGWRGSWGTTVSWLLLIALPCSTPCLPSIHICISSSQNSGFRARMIGWNRKTSPKPCYTQSFRLPQSCNCRKGRELTASLSNLHSRHWYSRSWNALNSIIINKFSACFQPDTLTFWKGWTCF